jgi:hypothetical protein
MIVPSQLLHVSGKWFLNEFRTWTERKGDAPPCEHTCIREHLGGHSPIAGTCFSWKTVQWIPATRFATSHAITTESTAAPAQMLTLILF